MAHQARNDGISRRSWLLAGLALPVFSLRAADSLTLSYDGDNVLVKAPDLHFLAGKALERLKEGATVGFVASLKIFSDARGTLFRQTAERMVLSCDLWEEKFTVTIPGRAAGTQSNLTAMQAETWCMENMAISAMGLQSDRPFWLRFDLRSASQKELSSVIGESGISVGALIELMSRRPGTDVTTWTRSIGPVRLADLPRIHARGRNG